IVLDEPNANLDSEGEVALHHAIMALKARGAIVVLIAHRPATLSVCDRLLVLANGVQQGVGPRDEILGKLLGRRSLSPAERDDSDTVVFPEQLTSRRADMSVAAAVAGEEKLFESRKTARTGQRSQVRERIAQLHEEGRGLSAEVAAKESELELIGKELAGGAELYQKKLVSISRYAQLERDQTRLRGERGQLTADIARARGKISETEL